MEANTSCLTLTPQVSSEAHVQEIDSNLCSAKDSILIEVYPKPNPFIYSLGNNTFCEGDSMTLFSDSLYNTLLWSNGLNTDSIQVYESDNYYLLVTDTNGCSNISNSIDVNFNPKPNVDFKIDGVCFENEKIFTDSSTILSGSIVSWIWDFGDGNYDTGPLVSHLYQETDLFNINLYVKSEAGCEDSASKNLQIFHVPELSLSFTLIMLPPYLLKLVFLICQIMLLQYFGVLMMVQNRPLKIQYMSFLILEIMK